MNISFDDDATLQKGSLNAFKYYCLYATPLMLFQAMSWSVHRTYRARIEATKNNRAVAEDGCRIKTREASVVPLPYTLQSTDDPLSLPLTSPHTVAPNLCMAAGANRRGPKSSKSALPPPKYSGTSIAATGLVVELSKAMEHWKKGLDS